MLHHDATSAVIRHDGGGWLKWLSTAPPQPPWYKGRGLREPPKPQPERPRWTTRTFLRCCVQQTTADIGAIYKGRFLENAGGHRQVGGGPGCLRVVGRL